MDWKKQKGDKEQNVVERRENIQRHMTRGDRIFPCRSRSVWTSSLKKPILNTTTKLPPPRQFSKYPLNPSLSFSPFNFNQIKTKQNNPMALQAVHVSDVPSLDQVPENASVSLFSSRFSTGNI